MKIENIECFLSLAEMLNYTEAAERQNMTQSALSKIILQMEDELGFHLLNRSRRDVSLTPAGKVFAEESRKTLDRYYSSISSAKNASAGKSGRVKLAVRIDLVQSLVMDIIKTFSQRYPNVLLEIKSMRNSDIVRAMDKGEIECAISTGTSRNENIRSVVLQKYRDCLVVRPEHPFAGLKTISLADASKEPFAVVARSFSIRGSESVIAQCRHAGFSPNIEVECVSIPHLFAALASGPYVTVLSDNFMDMAGDHFVFIPLKEEHYTYCKFHWDSKSSNSCVNLLADFVVNEFADYED